MRKKKGKILVVEDDPDVRFSLKVSLRKHFEEVVCVDHPRKMQEHLPVNVVLLDMNYKKGFEDGKEGLYWLQELKEKHNKAEVIMLTAYAEVELAVESLKKGAFDFILKPWDRERLLETVRKAIHKQQTKTKPEKKKTINKKPMVWGRSRVMQQLKNWMEKVAPTDANVLILGENGTGKYMLAQEIHQYSLRKNAPFVSVDLGVLNDNLFESELFGYVKGAFTDAKENKEGLFEKAKQGTVFLDEIGNLNPLLQSKLLSVIQNRTFSRLGETKVRRLEARIICATNIPIYEKVKEGSFRQDLLFRINTLEIEIQPLRNRKEDIEAFVEYFLNHWKTVYQKPDLALSNDAKEALINYTWPGNIRELENTLERAIILSEEQIEPTNLRFSSLELPVNDYQDLNLLDMEEKMIRKALQMHGKNISKAAKELGISRNALYRRMEKYNIL